MRYPRLTETGNETDAPATYRFPRTAPGRGAAGRDRTPHQAESAVERVQQCLDRLDAMMDTLPFERFDSDDEGPRAA